VFIFNDYSEWGGDCDIVLRNTHVSPDIKKTTDLDKQCVSPALLHVRFLGAPLTCSQILLFRNMHHPILVPLNSLLQEYMKYGKKIVKRLIYSCLEFQKYLFEIIPRTCPFFSWRFLRCLLANARIES
jgi:hypothetical protein